MRTARNKRKFKKSGRRNQALTPTPQVAINHFRDFASPRQRTFGVYRQNGTFLTGAATFSNVRIRPYNAVDPGILGNATSPYSGEVPWTGLYRKYRGYRAVTKVTFINLETFPVTVWLLPVNFDPGVSFSSTTALRNPLVREFLLSPKGGMDRCSLTIQSTTSTFGGSASFLVDDDYVGNTDNSAAPTNNVYHAYGIQNDGVAVSVAGVSSLSHTKLLLDYFELQT